MSDADANQNPPPEDQFRYEAKHPDYVRRPGKPRALGPGPVRHVVVIARADRRLADPAPEVQPTRITGRYQNADAAGDSDGPAFLLHVNQAGKHIEALLVDLSHGGAPRYFRFGGNLVGGQFGLTDADLNGGSLRVDGLDLVLDHEGVPLHGERFSLRELRPSFLDDSLEPLIEVFGEAGGDAPSARTILSEAERTPLTDAQMEQISNAFKADQIEPYLLRYNENASSIRSADRAQSIYTVDELEQQVGTTLNANHWDRQLETVREYVRRTLAFQKVTVGHSRKSLLQWMEDMTLEAIATLPDLNFSVESHPMTNLRELLGIRPGASATRNEYFLDLDLKHKGASAWSTIKAELYYGTMTVRSLTAQSFKEKPHTYNVVLVGGGALLGKGGEADLKAHAMISTAGEWTPADFPGALKLVEGGVWAGKKIAKKQRGAGTRESALILTGRGNHPEIIVPLEGLNSRRDGIGAEFAYSYGRVLEKGEELGEKDFSRAKKRVDYAVTKKDQQDVHFILGSALLRDRGSLRVCAAVWLPWLESTDSRLEIIGQADTVDAPKRNLELSEMRAKNVKQALKDILGDDLAIPEKGTTTKGLGDIEAARHDPDETPDLKYRRVDVELNGRCVLTLWSS